MERSSEPGQMISRVLLRPDINDSDDRTSKLIIFRWYFDDLWASLMAQLVKNLPTVQETWVWSLGWEDPLEKGTATHSSILAWRIPWTMGSQDWATFTFTFMIQKEIVKRLHSPHSLNHYCRLFALQNKKQTITNKANSVDEQLKGFSALVAQLKTQ